ncbi:DUF1499 domain-containing protein [Vibrio sp. SCSIO 43136]|uniref:DUF1499 domain-containing protein n=1 Tax=Vibrio sp. SCSIO 43136 TaxID=2819101 RepID=UPI002076407B|nr:DUF1499 domain-containing protein [Vibrio sp. SCSIO 43136]USD65714.1 DUF1499 domain-containing protein [Vibrio sp. SCSIO 43136]
MRYSFLLLPGTILLLAGCTGSPPTTERSTEMCDDRPRCVSTLDSREDFNLAPFNLADGVTLDQIEAVALTLPNAKTAAKSDNYLRIEYTTKIMRFVDDMELGIQDGQLVLRSESRLGHYDFDVNRERAEALREKLLEAGLVL